MCAAAASNAINFNINIEDASTIHMTANEVTVPLENGLNSLDLSEYTSIAIEGVNPYIIAEITDETGQKWAMLSSTWSKSIYTTDEGKTFNIKVRNLDETRTCNFTVNVDDASKVEGVMEGSYLQIPLHNGVNHLAYDPQVETSFIITSPIYGYEIYEVKVNGKVDPGYYGTYFVPLTKDCVIDITANYPDKMCDVNFVFTEGDAGFVNLLEVNGEAYDFDGSPLHVKSGTKLLVYASNNYNYKSVEVNGEYVEWDTQMPLFVTVKENTTIDITAPKWKMFDVYLICTDPKHIELFNGYTVDLQRIEIPSCECSFQVREDNPLLTWRAASGCKIEAIFIDGMEVDASRDWWNVSDGTEIEFVTSAKKSDVDFVFWMDDREGADLKMFTFENAERKHYDTQVKTGYNLLTTYAAGNPFTLAWYGTNVTSGFVFQNDELVNSLYPNTWNYSLTIEDEDIIKVYLTTDPEYTEVNFDISGNADLKVIKDMIRPVTEKQMMALSGSLYTISSPNEISVYLNDVAVEANEAGKYEFAVSGDECNVKIIGTDDSGIRDLEVENAVAPVYNLQGMRVGVSTDTLPAGIYVSNGRKFVVK